MWKLVENYLVLVICDAKVKSVLIPITVVGTGKWKGLNSISLVFCLFRIVSAEIKILTICNSYRVLVES